MLLAYFLILLISPSKNYFWQWYALCIILILNPKFVAAYEIYRKRLISVTSKLICYSIRLLSLYRNSPTSVERQLSNVYF